MKLRELAGNAITAFVSQGFSFLLSVLTYLLVSKVLDSSLPEGSSVLQDGEGPLLDIAFAWLEGLSV